MHTIRKVLIIRFSSIGDIVLTTPVVRALKQQLGCEIHYLTKEAYAPAIIGNQYVDRIITIREKVSEVVSSLRRERYDWVADLHHNLRSHQVKSVLRRPGASFPKLNVEKWLLTNFKVDRLPDVHIVDRYFATVKALGVTNDGQGLDFSIVAEDKVELTAESGGLLAQGNYVAMVIGAGRATKNLEETQWKGLIRAIDVPVALLGGPADADKGDQLANTHTACVNFAGRLRLGQSSSVVAQSACVITPDTGLMHIAAALRKPVISVWGNTVPAFGMAACFPDGLGQDQRFEVTGLSCRPCSKIGYDKCPKGHFRCIRELDMTEIIKAVHTKFDAQNKS